MKVTIPLEFATVTREQMAAGRVGSEEEAVAAVLQDSLAGLEALRMFVRPALASLDRGEGVDGEAFMRELREDTEAMLAAAPRQR